MRALTASDEILARVDSTCPSCKLPIVKGHDLIVQYEGEWIHQQCAGEAIDEERDRWTIERYVAADGSRLLEQLAELGVLFRINYLVLHEIGLSMELIESEDDDYAAVLVLRRATSGQPLTFTPQALAVGRARLQEAGLSRTTLAIEAADQEAVAQFRERIHQRREEADAA